MVRWSLFNKSKQKQEEQRPEEDIQEGPDDETAEEEKEPLAQHAETLYAKGSGSKKSSSQKTKSSTGDQRIWRDVNAIEENVDYIHEKKTAASSSEIDRTVDRLLQKRKRK
ncbi:MAG: hypothetical protein JW771_07045 [Candidatus Thermoplasmatota archaeon]|nr:hypothetical protein [Candidatus Thermoplasmatota archaeon]